jgi:hypothetical protein
MSDTKITLRSDRPLSKPGVLQDVLEALDAGEPAKKIADRYGVSDVALYRYLLKHAPQEWQALSAGQSLARIDREDMAMEGATNGVQLGRSRERMSLAKWMLERTSRPIFGDQAQLSVSAEQLGDLLMAISSRMLSEKQIQAIPGAPQQIDA